MSCTNNSGIADEPNEVAHGAARRVIWLAGTLKLYSEYAGTSFSGQNDDKRGNLKGILMEDLLA